MTIHAHALRGARLVRAVTLALAFGLLTCVVALRAFESAYGQHPARVVKQADTAGADLQAAIDRQVAQGRTCGATPVLTDVVLFERNGTGVVEAVTFDEALASAEADSGWVRGYCR